MNLLFIGQIFENPRWRTAAILNFVLGYKLCIGQIFYTKFGT